ncbi:MAG: hypothetical protein RSB51_02420 [Clostridia bacterium]
MIYLILFSITCILAIFLLPLTFEIKMVTEDIKQNNEKDYFQVSIYGIKIKKIEFENALDKIGLGKDKLIDYEKAAQIVYKKFLNLEEDIYKSFEVKDLINILNNVKYKKIELHFGLNTGDVSISPLINIGILTYINCLIGANISKLEDTYINIKMLSTENSYTYSFTCIFSTTIAKNITIIIQVIKKYIKERWKKVWQIIQLKV